MVSAALLAVIIGALCFSVGEGLRLTPFPISDRTETHESAFAVNTANQISLSQYGPLNVPAQTQKRSKRQTLELAVPASPGTRAAFTPSFFLVEAEAIAGTSILFVARPAGRAPPILS